MFYYHCLTVLLFCFIFFVEICFKGFFGEYKVKKKLLLAEFCNINIFPATSFDQFNASLLN